MQEFGKANTPWHLWVVGIVSLLWNAIGANDYLQSQLRNRDYLESMTGSYDITVDQMIAYIDGFPAWAEASWAFGVWGSVAGSLLLLFRSRFALWAFALSLAGAIVTSFYQFSGAMPAELEGSGQMVFAAIIWLIALGLIYYSWRMTKAGVLR
ncbi:hypothetical protein OAS19_02180 [Altererythrobacter sp.]|nr:hypothetical protein [Altererythrobacter sp.]